MKDRPILFSAPMVRAILAGTKTQTRRIVKPQPSGFVGGPGVLMSDGSPAPLMPLDETVEPYGRAIRCPYGQPGDRLWVRESFSPYLHREGCWYWADGNIAAYDCEKPRPSIHMWRWASRITLEITAVRVERLQDISEADAVAEGVTAGKYHGLERANARAYSALWESINGPGSWDTNPWVWVVEFRKA